MESFNDPRLIVITTFGLIFNASTLAYILSNFNVRVHVYTLLFIDALISTFSSSLLFSLDIFIAAGFLQQSFHYCNISFLALFLPTYCGGVLTFLVACIRFILAKKSARNIQVTNSSNAVLHKPK